eukprot:TRINITY_DN121680_c0_g1_i1.p1 TRINITY_DN121680_c0_g1~~TRINITY_DN121680_c0_g1_i1.p1  ORF type:complete len:600 (+),score=117.93 TRINITY_DN121680_c0_g1_i1:294-2093(+)
MASRWCLLLLSASHVYWAAAMRSQQHEKEQTTSDEPGTAEAQRDSGEETPNITGLRDERFFSAADDDFDERLDQILAEFELDDSEAPEGDFPRSETFHSGDELRGRLSFSIPEDLDLKASPAAPIGDVHRRRGAKTITFIRHGQSAGNAMSNSPGYAVLGLFTGENKYVDPRDGFLTWTGMKQAHDRVAQMLADDGLRERLKKVQVVIVSPLARAMGTTWLILADLCRDLDMAVPDIIVSPDLSEKVKTDSDRVGGNLNGDGADYIEILSKAALKYLEKEEKKGHPLSPEEELKGVQRRATLSKLKQNLIVAYAAAKGDKQWKHESLTSKDFGDQVNRLKETLDFLHADNILLIGHSGWSRYAFGHLWPSGRAQEEKDTRVWYQMRVQHLILAQHYAHPLNNCGVFQAKLENSAFIKDESAPGFGGKLGTPEFPNFEEELKAAVYVNPDDPRRSGLIDEEDSFIRFAVQYRKTERGSLSLFSRRWSERDLVLSYHADTFTTYIAILKSFDKPAGAICLKGGLCTEDATIRVVEDEQLFSFSYKGFDYWSPTGAVKGSKPSAGARSFQVQFTKDDYWRMQSFFNDKEGAPSFSFISGSGD